MQELAEDVVLELLKGQECILPDLSRAEEDRVLRVSCPQCGNDAVPILDRDRPFRTNLPMFRFLGRCTTCSCEFDPDTRIIRPRSDP